jgi:hypothetical protein
MSILYIKITETNPDSSVKDYRVEEVFKDGTEMCRWFAYDYHKRLEILEHGYCLNRTRFSTYIRKQRLCQGDYYHEYDWDYYQGAGHRISVYYQRTLMLYDDSTDRVLDIRNYIAGIEKHAHDAIEYTEYRYTESESKRLRRYYNIMTGRPHHTEGRIHRKSKYYRPANKFDPNVIVDDEYIPCVVTKPKQNVRLVWYNDFGCKEMENNWKQRKIRHQWQWHKP